MPIVRVLNWPSEVRKILCSRPTGPEFFDATSTDEKWKRGFSDSLRRAVVKAKVPGIDVCHFVTVSFDSGHVLPLSTDSVKMPDDRTLVIFVEGLFDLPERGKASRDRLADTLADSVHDLLLTGWKVEVLVTRFNDAVDSFAQRCKS